MEEIELKATRKRLGSEETVEKAIRRSRALAALRKMQKKSMKSKLNRLTDSQIRSEIRAVRKARRQ